MTIPQDPAGNPAPKYTGKEILRMGLWNYLTVRYAPKNAAGKLIFEIGILVAVFMVLGILFILTRS
jgi:hypothetical protein